MNSSLYRKWKPPQRKSEDRISLAPARKLLAALDRDPVALSERDPLPLLWHWLYFLPETPTSQLDTDGHPLRGDFMPPVDLPARMFAGFELEVDKPLTIGERAWRTEQVTAVEEKTGKSGRLLFVTVTAQIENQSGLLMREKQKFVYREAKPPVSRQTKTQPAGGDWALEFKASRMLLFRFSALTFNSHRIHYDREYAVLQEGYPDLVVHGPLVAIFMAEAIARNLSGEIKKFSFRQHAPLFAEETFAVIGGRRGAGEIELEALSGAGELVATGWCELY